MKFAGRFIRCIDRRLVAMPDAMPASANGFTGSVEEARPMTKMPDTLPRRPACDAGRCVADRQHRRDQHAARSRRAAGRYADAAARSCDPRGDRERRARHARDRRGARHDAQHHAPPRQQPRAGALPAPGAGRLPARPEADRAGTIAPRADAAHRGGRARTSKRSRKRRSTRSISACATATTCCTSTRFPARAASRCARASATGCRSRRPASARR